MIAGKRRVRTFFSPVTSEAFIRARRGRLKPFRLLVRSSNWFGDAVMSIPAVRAMRNGRPDCRLTVVCQSKLVPLWKRVSEVDAIVSLEDRSVFSTARSIRAAGPFDAAVLFPKFVPFGSGGSARRSTSASGISRSFAIMAAQPNRAKTPRHRTRGTPGNDLPANRARAGRGHYNFAIRPEAVA